LYFALSGHAKNAVFPQPLNPGATLNWRTGQKYFPSMPFSTPFSAIWGESAQSCPNSKLRKGDGHENESAVYGTQAVGSGNAGGGFQREARQCPFF
jgi:hypothetical protein